MKSLKIIIVAIVLMGFFFLAYTKGFIGNSATYLKVEADSVVMGKKGGQQKIAIDTDSRRWTVEYSPEWVKATKEGDSLKLEFNHTIGSTSLSDTIFLEAATQKAALPVKQYARATKLDFMQDTLYFKQSGGIQSVRFQTDGEKIDAMADPFADVTLADGIVTLNVVANESYAERISYVTVYSDQLKRRLYYRQAGTGIRNQVVRKVRVEPCTECGGLGKLLTEVNIATGERSYKICPVCKGSGRK